jgi:ubiquinone biosynthesis protein Coq4
MTATARPPLRTVSREIDEQTGVGEVYLRSLLRAQLRLGLSVIAVLALVMGTLPLLFSQVPRLDTVRLLAVPLPWVVVGISVYPLLFGLAWWQVVAAEHAERDFAAIVESD